MKCIVLGASGFLGKECINELLRRGDEVIALDRTLPRGAAEASGSLQFVPGNILDPESLRPIFMDADEVYLLAGQLGTSELENSIRSAVETNILGALTVFETAIACKVPHVFLASKPSKWLNTYTITKHAAEKIATLMTRYHPVKISVLRYLNIYGPGQKLYPVRKVLPIFAAQALRGLPLLIYGDGEQTVDMLFSKDAARLTVDVMRGNFNPDAMDCGTGVEMTVRAVAESVNRYYGNSAGVESITMRKGETVGTRLVADTRALAAAVGSLHFTPYEEALAASLEYYRSLPAHEIDAGLSFHGICQPFDMSWI